MGRRDRERRATLAASRDSGPYRRERHPLMTEPQRTALITSAIQVARIAFAGAIIGGCAVGLAAQADASSGSDCNPFYLSMTPQPVLGVPVPMRRRRPMGRPRPAPSTTS